MVKLVLVVTTVRGFGETLRQTLQETGRYQVSIAAGEDEALTYARAIAFRVAILDADTLKDSTARLAAALLETLPNMRLVLIPPKNDLDDPLLARIRPHGYLTKPFYAPDLLDTVDEVMALAPRDHSPTKPLASPAPPRSPAAPKAAPSAAPPPPWLEDVNRAAQHLTLLSLESSAHAALIVHGGKLWAYAGQLSQDAAQELVTILVGYWANEAHTNSQGDLARFVHLQATDRDYMLYATGLGGDMALALAFDVATPFSKIRSQAVTLARSLAAPPPLSEHTAPPAVETLPQAVPALQKADPLSRLLEPELEDSASLEDIGGEEETPLDLDLLPLLDDVPPPNPRRAPSGQQDASSSPVITPRPVESPPIVLDEESDLDETPQEADSASLPAIFETPALSLPEALSPEPEVAAAAQPDWSGPPLRFEEQPLSPTAPLSAAPSASRPERSVRLLPVSPALANLNYACLLIPRLPHHRISGDLADRLNEWMEQICLAFNWRLDVLTVRTDYLQWVVNVPPTTSPSYLMRVMRQQTSQRIFGEFPSLGRENPSGDFWAPGYLIMSNDQPPPAQVVKDFIQQTRDYQGATKPRRN